MHAGAAERSGLKTYRPSRSPRGSTTISGSAPPPGRLTRPRGSSIPHWFHISDYSLGYVSGWGIHHIDIAQWGNGTELTGPVEVEGSAQFPDDDALCDNPLSWDTRMKYANGVELIFTGDGPGFTGVRHGITFEGPDGWVWVNRGAIDAEPKSLLDERIGPDEIHLPVSTFPSGELHRVRAHAASRRSATSTWRCVPTQSASSRGAHFNCGASSAGIRTRRRSSMTPTPTTY